MLRVGDDFKSHARLAAQMVGHELAIPHQHILWHRRKAEYVRARHLAWWLVSETTGWSTPRIGRLFKRNHSSILTGIRQHHNRMSRDDEFAEAAHRLLEAFRGRCGRTLTRWTAEGDALREIWGDPLSAFYVR